MGDSSATDEIGFGESEKINHRLAAICGTIWVIAAIAM
jgi:hypothetical protein